MQNALQTFFCCIAVWTSKIWWFHKALKDHPYMVLYAQLLLGKHNILSKKRNIHVDFSNDNNTGSEKNRWIMRK